MQAPRPASPRSSYVVLGLMSGSSLDGLDLCAARFTESEAGWQYAILAADSTPFDAHWAARLGRIHHGSAYELAKLHTDFGHLLGLQARMFLRARGLQADLAASHGHTAFHQPQAHFTFQLGSGETAITYLDCPLVCDFRPRDVALGGQGAPLVPFGEQALFPEIPLFLNLGGIANVSVLPGALAQPLTRNATHHGPRPFPHLAFDLAPCNQVLNHLAHRLSPALAFDPAGAYAAQGQELPTLRERLAGLAFYQHRPPRSLGREYTEANVFPLLATDDDPRDQLHTFCLHLADILFEELQKLGVRDAPMLVTGGGAHNAFLMACLATRLAPLGITLAPASPELIDFKEALIFGFLGLCAWLGQPNVLTETTGARRPHIAGALHQPDGGVG
jgi:anhydro-N-acetylmuramic acid kinase